MLATVAPESLDLPPHERLPLARVVTLTPAPAIDRVYLVDAMRGGQVNRASRVETFLAGKGINVARALHAAGNPTVAVAPMADREKHLLDHGLPLRTVDVGQPTRVNAVIVTGDGRTTNVNETAAVLPTSVWTDVLAATTEELASLQADWLVIAGSVPTVTDATQWDSLARLIQTTQSAGVRVCVDSAGDTLRCLLAAGGRPDLVKPNAHELGGAIGRALGSVGDVVNAAHHLLDEGVGAVLASAGAEGALFITNQCELWASAPPVTVVNTTGAGDAALAGFLHLESGRHGDQHGFGDPHESLTRAVSWGTNTVTELTTTPATLALLPGIRIDAPRPGQLLSA